MILDSIKSFPCHGNDVVTTPGAIIVSPNYPDDYDSITSNCDSKLVISFNERIFLTFEFFDIEPNELCEFDWLEVRDGNSSEDNLIGSKLCGSVIPRPILSTGNSLTLVFHTDTSGSNKGFKIRANIGMKISDS